ncbi:DUF1963 domain-containing protein [Actinomadura alba]|uniref:DUF1963 domain-containing protein n=1 Tax=Actinomadura alba TaxID=406431 RepID=A0ABR7LPJ6_9ACTN|nr:DUF1963 domain-containing protein [Actinomadura alba]MBC6466420.1 DUF1963 domain-containing protein [Actinomadura alba]
MDYQAELAVVRELCVEHLGEHVGSQLAVLAKPGFMVDAVGEGESAAGRSRFGGPALLEPGTAWPECEGVPLSLFAVLDMEALGPWLGEEPHGGVGLLNLFFLYPEAGDAWEVFGRVDLDDPRLCGVLAAAPARAVEVPAPAGAAVFDSVPMYAEPMVTLPDPWDDVISRLDPGPDHAGTLYEDVPNMLIQDRFGSVWQEHSAIEGTLLAGQAFGWPNMLSNGPSPAKGERAESRHLLQLSSNELWNWSEGGWLHFMIPVTALRDGDLSGAWTYFDGV